MAKWLKRGKDVEARLEADRQVRATVETILGAVLDISRPDTAPTRKAKSKLCASSARSSTTGIARTSV